MTTRENILAVLRYQKPERFPLLCFGYWTETLDKWVSEGYVTPEEAADYRAHGDRGAGCRSVYERLGFDWSWCSSFGTNVNLFPRFPREVLETRPDGGQVIRDEMGLICLVKPGVVSIPSEIGTSLEDRESWEKLYLPRLQYNAVRIDFEALHALPDPETCEFPVGLEIGSLMGNMRNYLGVEGLSYLWADDEDLYREIVDTICSLDYRCAKAVLDTGARFDFAHYWEDICFKNGPLVSPAVFREVCGPWYRKISDLLHEHGVDLISLDCDGCIDALLPIWLENGVNVMFPIEVGTWNASVAPWREQYGRALLGVGGINKTVFAKDRAAVDAEVQRLMPLIRLGGFVPCVDHRIAPDAKFDLVQYFCRRMRQELGEA